MNVGAVIVKRNGAVTLVPLRKNGHISHTYGTPCVGCRPELPVPYVDRR